MENSRAGTQFEADMNYVFVDEDLLAYGCRSLSM